MSKSTGSLERKSRSKKFFSYAKAVHPLTSRKDKPFPRGSYKKNLNISVQHCIQVILCKKTVSVPPYSLGLSMDLQREKRFEMQQWVPFLVQSLRRLLSTPLISSVRGLETKATGGAGL